MTKLKNKNLPIILFLLCVPIFLFSKTLTLAATEFPPYVYTQKNSYVGFNVEILNAIFKQMNIKVTYKIVPWARAVLMLKNGEIDGMFPFLKNKNREVYTDYTESFTSEPFAMFVHNDSSIVYNRNLKKLSTYTIGRVRGYSSGDFFDSAVKTHSLKIDEASNSQQNINKFYKRRFDILVENKYYVLHQLKLSNKQEEIKELTPLLSDTKAYLGFSKKRNHQEIIKQFNLILLELKEDGTYDTIMNNYFKK